jgi:hypothetical protein
VSNFKPAFVFCLAGIARREFHIVSSGKGQRIYRWMFHDSYALIMQLFQKKAKELLGVLLVAALD